MKKSLTQNRLKELMIYNPNTGMFTSNVNRHKLKEGDICGSRSKLQYTSIAIDGCKYQASHLAFLYIEGVLPTIAVDHINGDRTDDRWENLREVTLSENQRNSRKPKNNTSGQVGVYYVKDRNNYRVRIRTDTGIKSVGCYKNYDDAVAARKAAEKENNYHPNHGQERKGYKASIPKVKNTKVTKYTGGRYDYPQSRLKDMLTYNPETGVFNWNINIRGMVKGSIAGSLSCDKGEAIPRYLEITLDRISYRAHNLAHLYMTGGFPKGVIDHLDGDSLNNKWDNLKDSTPSENSMNKRKQSNNTSGVTGVNWDKGCDLWQARIMKKRKSYHLGYFKNLEDAIVARKKAEIDFGFSKRHGK